MALYCRPGYFPVLSTDNKSSLAGCANGNGLSAIAGNRSYGTARPYIDVRASFNSFLPTDLDSITGKTLISAWLDRLEAHPLFPDKIEFEDAPACLDFCFNKEFDDRYSGILTKDRKAELKKLCKN